MVGEQRQAHWFGKNLVETAGKWEPLLSEVIKKLVQIENPNINFLTGILTGIYNLDSYEWNNVVRTFYEKDFLNQYYARALVTGNVKIEQLNGLIELIRYNKINPNVASTFTYGRALDHLDYESIIKLVKDLASISENSAWIAFDIITMYCYGDSEKWNNCKPTFREIIVTLSLANEDLKQGQLGMHNWHDVVKKLLQDDDIDFAKDISKQILTHLTDKINFRELWHYIQPIIRKIFKKYAEGVWLLFTAAIKDATPTEEFRLMQLLGLGSSFDEKKPGVLSDLPDELLKEWCLKTSETAPEFVARTTDVFLEDDDKYKFSPRAQFLLDYFGDNELVLSALSANMSSFGWSGSLVPYLQKEAAVIKGLKEHKNKNVRIWANSRLDYLSKMIERETRHDEEFDWGIY